MESAFHYATLRVMENARTSTPDSSFFWSGSLGMCSVTLRELPWLKVLEVATTAKLSVLEWGADIHAPLGNVPLLAEIRSACEQNQIRIGSYGSYWRAGESTDENILELIQSAEALGAPRIRIWAGTKSSVETSSNEVETMIASTIKLADLAAQYNIEIAFEFHENTFTDTPESALDLIRRINKTNVKLYWQPPNNYSDEKVIESLSKMINEVSAIHVFSWWPNQERHPLEFRSEMWKEILRVIQNQGRVLDLLLEFVPDNDPNLVISDAEFLRKIVGVKI